MKTLPAAVYTHDQDEGEGHPRYIERCCETCKFHRDADFQHWVICAGPARDMICQGLVTRHDAPPILVEKRFCCKFYEGLK